MRILFSSYGVEATGMKNLEYLCAWLNHDLKEVYPSLHEKVAVLLFTFHASTTQEQLYSWISKREFGLEILLTFIWRDTIQEVQEDPTA